MYRIIIITTSIAIDMSRPLFRLIGYLISVNPMKPSGFVV